MSHQPPLRPIPFQDRPDPEDGTTRPLPHLSSHRHLWTSVDELPYPSIVPEYFGDAISTNGQIWPKLTLTPALYRFRILAAANARTFRLTFEYRGVPLDVTLIGADGGLLPEPVQTRRVLIMGAQRRDVLIDLTSFQDGDEVTIINTAPDSPFQSKPQLPADTFTTGQVMRINIKTASSTVPTSVSSSVAPKFATPSTTPSLVANFSLPSYLGQAKGVMAQVRKDAGDADWCNDQDAYQVVTKLYENFDDYGRNWLQLDNNTFEASSTVSVPLNQVMYI